MAVADPAHVTQILLRIPGKPAGKQRPRFDPRTGRAFSPQGERTAENAIVAVWRDAGEQRLPDDRALGLSMTVVVTRPAGHYRRDGSLSAEGARHPVPRTQKPDLDNAIKLVCDALNGRAYRDDVRIAKMEAIRLWGDWPETRVRVFVLGSDPDWVTAA